MSQFLSNVINNSYHNLLINGNEGESHRNGSGFSVDILDGVSSGKYVFDRWQAIDVGLLSNAKLLATDPIGGPGIAVSGLPLGRIQRYEVTTGVEAAPAVGDIRLIQQKVEGTTLKAAAAVNKSTLAFLYMNATPGLTLSLALMTTSNGSTATHSYTTSITTVAGWKAYPVVIPPSPNNDIHLGTGTAYYFQVTLASGSTRMTSNLNQWQAGELQAANTQSNFFDTIGNFIEIDQMMLLSSDQFSTDFANNVKWVPHVRHVGGNLRAMQRYYANIDFGSFGNRIHTDASGVASTAISVGFPVKMRVPPSVTYTLEQNDVPGSSFSLTQNTDTYFNGLLPTVIGAFWDLTNLFAEAEL